MKYSFAFDDFATGAVANTYVTCAAVRAGDTAGYRCRVRSISVGPSADAPADLNVSAVLKRVEDVSAGGAGTAGSAPTPVPKDSDARASVCTAGIEYTVEPTTYGDALFEIDFNLRGGFLKEWAAEDAPICNRDQLIGLLAAPRSANAANLSGSIEFEEF